jgi:hypothetical protein
MTTSEQHEVPRHLSYSSRDTWQRCPKAYQLGRIIKAPQTVAWWNVGGSTVHAVLDRHGLVEHRKSHRRPGRRPAVER